MQLSTLDLEDDYNIYLPIISSKFVIGNVNNVSNVPLLEQAMEIIEKYKDHPICISKNTILPMRSNQKLNAYLKEIADICNIRKPMTMHIARHTFATTVLLSNGVSMEATSKMLGHTSLKTTQIYAKVIDDKKRDAANRIKLNF